MKHKGEISWSLVVGIVLLIAIVVVLILTTKSSQKIDINLEDNTPLTQQTADQGTPTNGVDASLQTSQGPVVPAENPAFPKTGLGPNE